MPDKFRETISASQAAALFDQSPYLTRWMLYHWLKEGVEIDDQPNERMDWGTILDPIIVKETARAMRFEVEVQRHPQDQYLRMDKQPLGCTPDGIANDPSRGVGIIEAKNVDAFVWRSEWRQGDTVPPHIEIQVQTQMMVVGAEWAVIAALVGGNKLELIERRPDQDIQEAIIRAAWEMMEDVKAGREPDAFGSPRELPILARLYPQTEKEPPLVLDDNDGERFVSWCVGMENASAYASEYSKMANQFKAKILAKSKEAGHVVAGNYDIYINKKEIPESLVQLPNEVQEAFPGLKVVNRKAHVRTSIKIKERDQSADNESEEVSEQHRQAYYDFMRRATENVE